MRCGWWASCMPFLVLFANPCNLKYDNCSGFQHQREVFEQLQATSVTQQVTMQFYVKWIWNRSSKYASPQAPGKSTEKAANWMRVLINIVIFLLRISYLSVPLGFNYLSLEMELRHTSWCKFRLIYLFTFYTLLSIVPARSELIGGKLLFWVSFNDKVKSVHVVIPKPPALSNKPWIIASQQRLT